MSIKNVNDVQLENIASVNGILSSNISSVSGVKKSNILFYEPFTGASLDTSKWDLTLDNAGTKIVRTYTGSELKANCELNSAGDKLYIITSKTAVAPKSGWVYAFDYKLTNTQFFQYIYFNLLEKTTGDCGQLRNFCYTGDGDGKARFYIKDVGLNVIINSTSVNTGWTKGVYNSLRFVWNGVDKTYMQYWNSATSAWVTANTVTNDWGIDANLYVQISLSSTYHTTSYVYVKNVYVCGSPYTTQYPT